MAAVTLAAERHRQLFHKGVSEGTAVCLDLPIVPGARPLVPGMTATMRVYLDRVSAAYLLPSSAVYNQGGKTYILLVRDGVTQQVPVRVQVNDGRMTKVALLAASGSGIHDLTGNEEVVVSRQMEIGDRAKVRTVLGEW
jgi:multidrug efflux pump subunit AcrA (membrane-fusion protein)